MPQESKTYSVPVPAELDAQVRADMASSGFNSLSEYVRGALRARLERSARRRLETQLAHAVERGDYGEAAAEVLSQLKRSTRNEEADVGRPEAPPGRTRRRRPGRQRHPSEQRLEDVLATLRTHEAELRERGVTRAAVFGSTARGDASSTSDVDIVVDLDPKRPLGVFEFVSISRYMQELIPRADVVERKALKPRIRERILEEAIVAF